MIEEKLFDKAVRLLKECPRHISLADIAKGTGLTASWLSEFSRGTIPDPGVHKIQKLVDWLSIERAPSAGKFPFDKIQDYVKNETISTVYIVFKDEEVIYIGCTIHPFNRFRCHHKWADLRQYGATHVELIYFEDDKNKKKALPLELSLIKQHSPKFNYEKHYEKS